MWKKFNFVAGNNTFLKPPLRHSEADVRVHQTELSVLIWSLLTLSSRSDARWDLYESDCTVRTANQGTSRDPLSAPRQLFKYRRQPAASEGRRSQNDWGWSKENSNKRESAGIFPFQLLNGWCRETSLVMFSWLCDYSKAGLQTHACQKSCTEQIFPFLVLRTSQIYSGSENIDFSWYFFFFSEIKCYKPFAQLQ